jgi:hypothetical protein
MLWLCFGLSFVLKCDVISSVLYVVHDFNSGLPALSILTLAMKPHLTSSTLMDDWPVRRIVKTTTFFGVCTYCGLPLTTWWCRR